MLSSFTPVGLFDQRFENIQGKDLDVADYGFVAVRKFLDCGRELYKEPVMEFDRRAGALSSDEGASPPGHRW